MKRNIVLGVVFLIAWSLRACSEYSHDEQAAVDAYTRARTVFLSRNYEAIRNTLTGDRLKGIEDMMAKNGKSFNEIMESIQDYMPSEVRIVKVTLMGGNGAFLDLEGARDGKTVQGNSYVKKEEGTWKVDNENWFWKGLPKK